MSVNNNPISSSNQQESNAVNQPQVEAPKLQGKADEINNFCLSIKERIGLWEMQTTGRSTPSKKVTQLKNNDLAKENLQKLLDEFDPNENLEPKAKKKEKSAHEEVTYKALIQSALVMEEPRTEPLVEEQEFKSFSSTLASLEEELSNVTFDEPKALQKQEKMETQLEKEVPKNEDHSNNLEGPANSEEVDLQARLNALEALANYTVENLKDSAKTGQLPVGEDLDARFAALEEYANLTMENLSAPDKTTNVSPLEDERKDISSEKPKRKRVFTPSGIDPIAEKKLWRNGVFLGKGDSSNTSIEKSSSNENAIASSENTSHIKKSRFSLTRFLRKAAKKACNCWENMTLPKMDTKRTLDREVTLLKTTLRKDEISK